MAPTLTRIGGFFDRTAAYAVRVSFYTGPTSYVTGGESFPPETIALGSIELLLLDSAANTTRTLIRIPRYSVLAKKMQWFEASGAEVAANTNLSDYGARFIAYGH